MKDSGEERSCLLACCDGIEIGHSQLCLEMRRSWDRRPVNAMGMEMNTRKRTRGHLLLSSVLRPRNERERKENFFALARSPLVYFCCRDGSAEALCTR